MYTYVFFVGIKKIEIKSGRWIWELYLRHFQNVPSKYVMENFIQLNVSRFRVVL